MTIPRIARVAPPAQAGWFEALEGRALYSTYDIIGVQAAALDQPQVHVLFRTTPGGDPLGGTGPDDGASVKAFLDTGSSGVLLSKETVDTLNIPRQTYNGQDVEFIDVGVAGGEFFDVATPLYSAVAPVRSVIDPDQPVEAFDQAFGPYRAQVNQHDADDLIGELNIVGMPALRGKVAVMDPSPLNTADIDLLDGMQTYVYAPGTPFNPGGRYTDPGIPAVNRHVKVSYGSFARFTEVTPAGAPGPTLADNPFIGPDPARAPGTADDTPAVRMTEGGRAATGSFLLDTGAAASFVSRDVAGRLGVHYRDGTYGTEEPLLVDADDVPVPNQFVLPIGGIGGSVNAAGFRIDSLALPTIEGEPIRFIDAPVMVLDVAVQDPVTGQEVTLDGDFGMNFLVASLSIDGGDTGDGAAGAFDWITFDEPNGLLGLELPDAGPVVPEPATIAGTLFVDRDADGVRDAGEAGLAGRTVYLDKDGSNSLTAGDTTATTAADGSYTFSGLTANLTYKVRQAVPSGWRSAGPAVGGGYAVTPYNGEAVAGKDFGSYTTATLKGTVFLDAGANGVRDSADGGMGGWTVWLDLNRNGTKDATDRSAVTDPAGNYAFAGLTPGTYAARVVGKAGYRQTAPAGNVVSATLASGQTLAGKTFGFTKRASVSGYVFADANRNAVRNTGEAGLAGWKVYLDGNRNGRRDGSERYVITSGTGSWAFNDLLAGTAYAFRVEQQAGWVRTVPASGSYAVTPTGGQVATGKNFGERR